MAGVDSLLRIVLQHGGDELRLGTDQAPRMLQKGSPLRFSVPETSEDTLRHLLDPLLTEERETHLREQGKVEFAYAPDGSASFCGHPPAARERAERPATVRVRGPVSAGRGACPSGWERKRQGHGRSRLTAAPTGCGCACAQDHEHAAHRGCA